MTAPTFDSFRLQDAPMALDRTAGWNFVRDRGEVFQIDDGTWMLTSREAVRFAQRHPEIFSSAGHAELLASPVPLIPMGIDPPDHAKYRRVLDPMFAPQVINAMADDLRYQVCDLVARFADDGECDVVTDLARLYPTQVFLTMFGMPLEDRDQFIEWVDTIVEASRVSTPDGQPPSEVVGSAAALFGYLQRFIDEKRGRPGDDVLSRILARRGADAWSNDEVLGLCYLLTLAGLDTVTAAIGFVMLHLARDAALRRHVVGDPSQVEPLIEEVLRLELPAPLTPRVTTQDVVVRGTPIPAGACVHLCLATANREPELAERPDEIDLANASRGHLSFGGGIHRCLGSHLARRELRLVVEEFHNLIPEYELAPGFQPKVVWPSGTLHLESLPLVFPVAGVR